MFNIYVVDQYNRYLDALVYVANIDKKITMVKLILEFVYVHGYHSINQ